MKIIPGGLEGALSKLTRDFMGENELKGLEQDGVWSQERA